MWKLIETWLKTLKWSKLRSIQRFSISKCSNWYNRSICTLLYINMTARNRSLCTKFILYAIILYGDQIVRRSFFMAPIYHTRPKYCEIIKNFPELLPATLCRVTWPYSQSQRSPLEPSEWGYDEKVEDLPINYPLCSNSTSISHVPFLISSIMSVPFLTLITLECWWIKTFFQILFNWLNAATHMPQLSYIR